MIISQNKWWRLRYNILDRMENSDNVYVLIYDDSNNRFEIAKKISLSIAYDRKTYNSPLETIEALSKNYADCYIDPLFYTYLWSEVDGYAYA